MNFEPAKEDFDFQPGPGQSPIELIYPSRAEEAIVGAIIEGSGGPDNSEITDGGLRFVRFLLATSRSARSGFVPNLKDIEVIKTLARQFIDRCGGPSAALTLMLNIKSRRA